MRQWAGKAFKAHFSMSAALAHGYIVPVRLWNGCCSPLITNWLAAMPGLLLGHAQGQGSMLEHVQLKPFTTCASQVAVTGLYMQAMYFNCSACIACRNYGWVSSQSQGPLTPTRFLVSAYVYSGTSGAPASNNPHGHDDWFIPATDGRMGGIPGKPTMAGGAMPPAPRAPHVVWARCDGQPCDSTISVKASSRNNI